MLRLSTTVCNYLEHPRLTTMDRAAEASCTTVVCVVELFILRETFG